MMEKRAKWEDEVKQRGLQFQKADQTQRMEAKKEAEQKRLDRAKKTSQKLAKEHRRVKNGVTKHKSAPKNIPRPSLDEQEAS